MTGYQEDRSRRGATASSDTENEASRETEIGLLAEAFHERPRTRRRLRQDAENYYARLRGEAEGLVGPIVAGEGPTAYLLALFFDGT